MKTIFGYIVHYFEFQFSLLVYFISIFKADFFSAAVHLKTCRMNHIELERVCSHFHIICIRKTKPEYLRRTIQSGSKCDGL